MENPTFHLEGVVKSREEMEDFTGPLSLILMLLSKNKIEIRDLHISDILEQYLEYIDKMQSMDLDVASEFVQMASHLVYIKTRTLLAGEEEVEELEELMSSLEQLKCRDAYVSIKAVTAELASAASQGALLFSKQPEPLKKLGSRDYCYSHEPHELLSALLSIFSRGVKGLDANGVLIPKRIVYGVKEKSRQLVSLLGSVSSRTLKELYLMSHSRSEVIATFVSVLELCAMGSLLLYEDGGELSVKLCGDVPEELSEFDSE